jgi:hypothetical protein
MIPIPQHVLSQAIFMLQKLAQGPPNQSFIYFDVLLFRQGLDFASPGVTILVAEGATAYGLPLPF